MLSYAELPGVYVDKSRGSIFVLDGVACEWIYETQERSLSITNPHATAITVKLLVEDDAERSLPLGACSSANWRRLKLSPGVNTRIIV